MPQTQLTVDTLGELDNGIARALIQKEIDRAVADLVDRGEEDGKVRKVTIEVEMGLHQGLVVAHVAAQAKIPPRRSRPTVGKLRVEKGRDLLLFQPHDSSNPDQETLPFEEHQED